MRSLLDSEPSRPNSGCLEGWAKCVRPDIELDLALDCSRASRDLRGLSSSCSSLSGVGDETETRVDEFGIDQLEGRSNDKPQSFVTSHQKEYRVLTSTEKIL